MQRLLGGRVRKLNGKMSWAVVLCCAAGPIASHAQTVSTVASFGTSTDPPASLMQGTDGNFYGTTQIGGIGTCFINNVNLGCGTVFSVTPGGSETTLYQFDGKADGGEPNPNLI